MGRFSAFEGLEVEQVWVWWSLRLVFALEPPGTPGPYIDVTEFRFTEPDGQTHDINIERDPVDAGPVLGVLHHRVTEATVVDWELRLRFDQGARLICPPLEQWEAWAASLPDSTTVFCQVGGGSNSPT